MLCIENSSSSHKYCRDTDVLYCIALKQAVWILWLQRLLVLHRAKPPGIVNDAAEPHTWREEYGERTKRKGCYRDHNTENNQSWRLTNLAASCAL